MAVGPTLGTGLFIGAGPALAVGGPASLLISYIFLSVLTYALTTTLAEVAAHMPLRHGTMVANGYLYLSSSLAFATAYLRWYSLAMLVPYEITAAMVNLHMWSPGSKVALRLLPVTAIVVGFNFLPERLFKRSEVLFTQIKAGTLAALFFLSVSIALGGATGHDKWGFQYWRNPGAFHEYLFHGAWGRYFGLLQCLLNSTIAFIFAPEMIVHRAETAESAEPIETTESIDTTSSTRIASQTSADIFTTAFPYILNSVAMGVMAPFTDPQLTNDGAGAGQSPYVIGIQTAQIRIVPVIATIAILMSSVASARAFLYLSSRTLCALSELGHAPSWLKVRNRYGIPHRAIIVSAMFSSLGWMCVGVSSTVVFNWFLRFVTTSGYISWFLSCVVHGHFRRRLKENHISPRHRFSVQPHGSYFGVFGSVILLTWNVLHVARPWSPIPPSEPVLNNTSLNTAASSSASEPRGMRVLTSYLGLFVFIILYIGHRFRHLISRPARHEADNHREHGCNRENPAEGGSNRSPQGQGKPDNHCCLALELQEVPPLNVDCP